MSSSASRLFVDQPDRIAAAWRRSLGIRRPRRHRHLLDCVVEPFVREVGEALAGAAGSPWSRTRGVLRVSADRGVSALLEEFSALRRCMDDALESLASSAEERATVRYALDEAQHAALALHDLTFDPGAEQPLVRFGGLVVEFFEQAAGAPRITEPELAAVIH